MGGIDVGRWIGGGLAAGALIWVLEGASSIFYMDAMEGALTAHGLSMEPTAGVMALSVLVSLLVGLTLVFFYAAARPRFGPGPRTALLVAVVLWIGSYVVSLIGYHMMGLFPADLLTMWGIVGLVEMVLAALLGGWIYREETEEAAAT